MMQLLGVGLVSRSVALSRDETEAVKKLYGYKPEKNELMRAGAERNAIRDAEADGLRLLAWFAQYVPAGEDPLKHFIQLCYDAGLTVNGGDLEWATAEDVAV